MDEMNNNTTLTPDMTAEPVQPAPQAQAQMAAPAPSAPQVTAAQAAVSESQMKFTPEEQAKIDKFAETINVSDTNMVLQYGSGAQ